MKDAVTHYAWVHAYGIMELHTLPNELLLIHTMA